MTKVEPRSHRPLVRSDQHGNYILCSYPIFSLGLFGCFPRDVLIVFGHPTSPNSSGGQPDRGLRGQREERRGTTRFPLALVTRPVGTMHANCQRKLEGSAKRQGLPILVYDRRGPVIDSNPDGESSRVQDSGWMHRGGALHPLVHLDSPDKVPG